MDFGTKRELSSIFYRQSHRFGTLWDSENRPKIGWRRPAAAGGGRSRRLRTPPGRLDVAGACIFTDVTLIFYDFGLIFKVI